MNRLPLTLVTATRLDRDSFWKQSLLGQSLRTFPKSLLPKLMIAFDNDGKKKRGLSELYNRAIDRTPSNENLLFVHDDVYLHDVFLSHRLAEAFKRFAVVGLAGSRGSDLAHPSWGLAFDSELHPVDWQRPDGIVLSGAVSHLSEPHDPASGPPTPILSVYGNTPEPCTLLDGLFLAAQTRLLKDRGVKFDPSLDFHLYDLDFCRAATRLGLTLGTWPILVTHGSGGSFSSPSFKKAARYYLDKWKLLDEHQARVEGHAL